MLYLSSEHADSTLGMRMPWLTKSRFLSGLQCHKRLWFEIHEPHQEVAEPSLAILQGRQFDKTVQALQPGVVISRERGLPAAIAATKRVLAQGAHAPSMLYQPAFRAGNLAVIVDVLRHSGARFDVIEVKASTAVKDEHIPDLAFQTLVLQRAKIPTGRAFIGHVNNQFVLRRYGDYAGLLVEADVTDTVQAYLAEAAHRALEFQAVMMEASAPHIDVGAHCTHPFECPFLERCRAASDPAAQYPLDVLPRGGELVASLLADGYRDLRDVPAQRLTNELHRRIYDATCSGLAFFDFAATAELRQLRPPFAYLDFESMTFSVPELIGTRPYEQLPFQWSVHVEYGPDDIRHAEYLAIETFGDFDECVQALLAALPASGAVFAYHAMFEKSVLMRLAELVPPHAAALQGIAARLVDLLPITREAYYHRDMRGSWSLKSVIPTIDAAMSYANLNEVREGGGAQQAFLKLRSGRLSDEKAKSLRAALLMYCRHDTWVMVMLRRFLCGEDLCISRTAAMQ
jgi:hypothetical protein